MPSLNEVTNDDVVEVFHGLPLDALPQVLLLLLLEGQLDEQLLQLLIAEVNAELFEAARETWSQSLEHCEHSQQLLWRQFLRARILMNFVYWV